MQQRMNEVVDGEYQNYKAKGGAYTREHFFGSNPELLAMVERLSDDDIMRLNRGGHDPFKVYAAYHARRPPQGRADGRAGQNGERLRNGRCRGG